MAFIKLAYIDVQSEKYGVYSIIDLKGVNARDLRGRPQLTASLEENFGERFVIVQRRPDGSPDYYLSEHLIGVPTPEFKRQLKGRTWQDREIEIEED